MSALRLVRDLHLRDLEDDLIAACERMAVAARDLAAAVKSGDTTSETLAYRDADTDVRAARMALDEHLFATAAARAVNRMRGVSRLLGQIKEDNA